MAEYKDLIRMSSKDRVKGIDYVKEGINLCRLPNGLVCMGCCGLDFAKKIEPDSKLNFVKALRKSSDELKMFDERLEYKKRYESYDLHDCGMCKQLVMDEEGKSDVLATKKHLKIYCPLHPAQNNGKELRKGECDTTYMCKTQRKFLESWDEETKMKFLDFIKQIDPDWFTYSVNMYNDEYLKEFLRS